MSIFNLEHVPPNPSIDLANSIVPPPGTTEIVSQGGGSTIDVAKWVARKYGLKHTAIPTTAGTGSEVTRYVVLTVDGKKTTFADARHTPDGYVLDPRKVVSLSRLHTISSGVDALSQALEAMWSRKTTMEAQAYATVAMELVLKNLYESIKDPNDLKARMNMMIAANMSGRAINLVPTNICHAISYPLTDWYGIPHGIACGMTLGYFADKHGFRVKSFLQPLIPRYKIDRKKVAKEVINSEKIKDYPLPVTELDILKALA